jgi:hypothetical protein
MNHPGYMVDPYVRTAKEDIAALVGRFAINAAALRRIMCETAGG